MLPFINSRVTLAVALKPVPVTTNMLLLFGVAVSVADAPPTIITTTNSERNVIETVVLTILFNFFHSEEFTM